MQPIDQWRSAPPPSQPLILPPEEDAPARPSDPFESPQIAPDSRCATHHDARAIDTCDRCGDYVCDECASFAPTGAARCESCPSWRRPMASPIQRLGAALIDFTFAWVPLMVLVFTPVPQAARPFLFWGIFVGALITNITMSALRSQTVGKALLGIQVINHETGARAEFWRIALLRNFLPGLVSALPVVGALFGLCDHLSVMRDDRRAFRDLIAGTAVVRLRRETSEEA